MSVVSIINPLLTLEYIQTENENKYFEWNMALQTPRGVSWG